MGTLGTPLKCVIVDHLGTFFYRTMNDNARFDNTTSIYLINLPWKLGLGLGLDLRSCTNLTFSQRIKKTNFTESTSC